MKQHNKKRLSVYLWVISFFKPYIGLLFLFILSGAGIILCEMSIPYFIQVFIDKVIMQQNAKEFTGQIIYLILAIMVMLMFIAMNNVFQRILPEKSARDLQYSVYRHLRKLGFSYFERKPVGETLSLLNTEVLAVQSIYRDFFPGTVYMILSIVFPLVVISIKDYLFTLIILGSYLLFFTYGPYIDKKVVEFLKKQTDAKIALGKKTYDSISAMQEVRAYHAREWEVGRFTESFQTYKDARLGSLFYRLLRPALCVATTSIGNIGFFIFGSSLVKHGEMTIGEFSAYIFYFMMVMRQINGLSYVFTEQMHLLGQAENLYDFIKVQPDIVEPVKPRLLPQVSGNISLHNVSFHYQERTDILKEFNLEIKSGERVAFVGASGNGKSTVLKLLDRFYDPQEGVISLEGVSLKDLSLSQLRNSIGYVFQETYLFGTTIGENIRFGNPEATDEEVIQAAKAAYAHEFIMETEHQYETLVGERGVKLSGGQKQRIAIARMFIKNPTILLLDEATSALDNVSEAYIKKALDQLSNGRTTVAIAHRISTIMDYDKLVYVQDGKVAEIGTYQELIQRKGLFYELVEGVS
ncbi:ABC transporter ATP-binding protein [Lacrimispora sp.]|uniref:ABC transporter ATP-binding protein n=1 Tax=Lacrimispora sp. TaxID=2719234 RepID=UPI0028A86130|nr:ABC transporter ATP-binding protein [Lacrimispora sp.]